MLVITAVENGIHSLAKGLEAFEKFHIDPTDKFALKDAVIRSHHAIETLLKAVLYEHNPLLLLPPDKIDLDKFMRAYPAGRTGESSYLQDQHTIGLVESLRRLKEIQQLAGFDNADYKRLCYGVERLTRLRNNLQHFGLEVQIDVVGHVLGVTIPRFRMLLDHLALRTLRGVYTPVGIRSDEAWQVLELAHMQLFRWLITAEEIFPGTERVINLLASRYDKQLQDAAEFFATLTIDEAPIVVELAESPWGALSGPRTGLPALRTRGVLNLDLTEPEGKYYNPAILFHEQPLDRTLGRSLPFYDGRLVIDQPTTSSADPRASCVASGTISFSGEIRVPDATDVLAIPDGQSKVRFLRNLTILIDIAVQYTAAAADYNGIRLKELLDVSGEITLQIQAFPEGLDSSDNSHALIGMFRSALTSAGSSLALSGHADGGNLIGFPRSFQLRLTGSSALRFRNLLPPKMGTAKKGKQRAQTPSDS